MNLLKKYRYEILIFIIEAVCMIIELVASRVLSPYFGSSQIVWTSVIAIILLSSSIGHYCGGKLADQKQGKSIMFKILMVASILTFIIPLISTVLLDYISLTIDSIKVGAILSAGILFLAPSLFLGMMPPIILKEKIKNIDSVGTTSGTITAISTVGAIFGTILGGFVLVPNVGCIQIIFVLSALLSALALIVSEKKKIWFPILILILSIIFTFYYSWLNNSMEEKVLAGELNAKISFDTEYGRAIIYNEKIGPNIVRVLNIDAGYESLTYIDEENKHIPASDYLKKYDLIFKSKEPVNDVLMLGGAGYSYPRHYISTYLDKRMDVVEIDDKVTLLAKKYFFLDDLIKEYDLDNTSRLKIYSEDGRTFINKNKKKYDVVLNDAFSGEVPAKILTTKEAIEKIKNSLTENGIYASNIVGSKFGKSSKFFEAELNTMSMMFKNVYVVPLLLETETIDNYNQYVKRNHMVLASNQDLEIEDSYKYEFDSNVIVLTDDYCPVDTLIDVG